MSKTQKITPFLWFDQQAEEAANFYVAAFNNSSINHVSRQGEAVFVVDFTLGGQRFNALNGGPMFKFNPSVSFFVVCETEAETEATWKKLIEGGVAMMPLDQYPWSAKYGFLQDRYGLCWQISLGKISDTGQKFTPTLLFTGPQKGRGKDAVELYTSLFHNAALESISYYEAGENGPLGTVKHAQFQLEGQTFKVMDNPTDQAFTFNESMSFVVHCADQAEVDYYWEKLTANGGEESRCGWLKDPFGLSWQIIPDALPRLLSDPDPAVAQRAMSAMMQMHKIEIEKLTQMPDTHKTPITVTAIVNAPVEKVWQCWTEPEHIQQWCNASDDWHAPKAENDLREGGKFVTTMAAKDGSFSFDFGGIYDEVIKNQRIAYTMEDGRKVRILFESANGMTHITETFEAENMNSLEMQQAGWQAILNNFKRHTEAYV
jgi:predicted 3-demethylubiquinone-9 3-methyltransferase (glyoxalase superfamily)/uncharacterized protein YndB with AHSA1/START domain